MDRYRIVLALDRSPYAEIVLEHALDQAARHDEVDLHFITIIDASTDAEDAKSWLAAAALEGLDAFSAHCGNWRTRLHVRVGKPDDEIANLAGEVDADLLVLGNYGTHRRSIADRVLARVSCPTLVVGLAGHVAQTEKQCPDCVATRATSDGERWFCKSHSADVQLRMSTILPVSLPMVRGGTLW